MIARSFGQHPKILVLNDPARGIDVNTKKDLYFHLRNYVEEGNSVVFLSSELEEFIGLCSKVLVFRHGSVFDIFENEKVNADSLLKGMFGQTQGIIGSTSISKSNNTSISEKVNDTNTNLRNVDVSDKKIIKIVDFDKEKKLREEGIQKKIKVKYF
jgi:ABC-type multidrug transport system ATPase subunit